MLQNNIRVFWLASENTPPPLALSETLNSAPEPLKSISSWEEARPAIEHDPSSVFLIDSNFPISTAIKKILAKNTEATILALHDEDTGSSQPAPFKHHGIITKKSSKEAFNTIIQESIESKRKEKRLSALRDHHRAARSFSGNPALTLITEVVKLCTASESYEDILSSTKALFPAVMYSDAALIILDKNNEVASILTSSIEKKSSGTVSNIENPPKINLDLDFENPTAEFVRPDSVLGKQVSQIRKQPWGSAITMGFRGRSSEQTAVLILFRKDLFPFTEKDAWILELAYHPMSLALDKVKILDRVHKASSIWRSTFDGITEGITVINSNYEIVKANRAFAKLVDSDVKSLKGRYCYSLLANKRSPCKGCPIKNLPNEQNVGSSIYGKSGNSIRAWSYSVSEGTDKYHFQFYRDTSREAGLASRLIQAEKIAALGKIVSAIAHELNNPIGGIMATAQLLLRDGKNTEELNEIQSAAIRSKKIIDTLLGFTSESYRKTESGLLSEAISSTLMLVSSGLGKIKVRSKIKCINVVINNFPALQQVLFNLITNSIHAMDNKGTISISASKKDDKILILVADTGPGIAVENQKHIFDPFFSSKAEGQGTGLGLSIVKNLVERMGGTIEVNSKKNEGTIFSILIPEALN